MKCDVMDKEKKKEFRKAFEEVMRKDDERLMKLLPRVRKLDDDDMLKIIRAFDVCMECWNLRGAAECKYLKIRKKIGLNDCSILEIAKRRKQGKC